MITLKLKLCLQIGHLSDCEDQLLIHSRQKVCPQNILVGILYELKHIMHVPELLQLI